MSRACMLLTVAVFVMFALVSTVPAAAAEDGWVDVLPGGDSSKHWTTQGNWKTEDGAVALVPSKGQSGWTRFDHYLWLNGEYDDFEMQFDYMVQKNGNSGFYFNVGDKASPVATGIEVQIYDSGSRKEGHRLSDHDSGGIIPGIPPTKNAAKPAGEWNRFHITVKGNDLTVKLNDVVVNEVTLDEGRLKGRPDKGYIGFQDHSLPLKLKDIKIRKL